MDAALEQRWDELAPHLDQLLPLAPEQREAQLRELALDAQLEQLLRQLLEADDAAGSALEAGCAALREEEPEAPTAPPIAGYRVLRFLGAGGMASVFLAERELADARQRVALKLLRFNVHDPQERRLFQREQTALARLEHVHIARLVDAGFAADGTPWLAMEYVEGESLLDWCDARRLAPRARAALFLDICAAVTAAHQALIVHRDLKPANVIVRVDGTVKLVDFGIAKLLEADAESTRTELRRLTPAYAAPEQFRGDPVGAGADIYALGVMLAELLSGVRPALRRDGSPARLDTRAVDPACAMARGLDATALRRLLRGDIDAIVARALRPEPAQRYASADALAADVRAWLEFRPVAARRGSRRYRLGRFLRRNRLALAAALLAGTALLGFSAISLRLARQAELAAAQSRADAQRARHVQDFVLSLFRSEQQSLAGGGAVTAADLVERALRAAREDFRRQPESLVPLLTALGELERNLGRNARSLEVLGEATTLAAQAFGPGHTLSLQAEAELAYTRFRTGDYTAAAAQLEQALRAHRAHGGGDSEAVMAALVRLGMLDVQLNRESQAIAQLDEAVQLGRRLFAEDHPALQRALEIYGGTLADNGRLDQAAAVLTDNLALARRIYGPVHLTVASALESLAVIDMNRARLDSAAVYIAEAADIVRVKAPAANTMAAYVANTEGVIALRRGQPETARQAFGRALEIYHQLYAQQADHPMLAATQANLGRAAEELDDTTAAIAHFGEAQRISRVVRAPDDARVADFRCHWAAALARGGDARADAELNAALTLFEGAAGGATTMHADCLALAAQARLQANQPEAALHLVQRAARVEAGGVEATASRLRLQRVGAQAQQQRNEPAAAAQFLRAALALPARSFTPRQSAADWEQLAVVAQQLGDADAAAQARRHSRGD